MSSFSEGESSSAGEDIEGLLTDVETDSEVPSLAGGEEEEEGDGIGAERYGWGRYEGRGGFRQRWPSCSPKLAEFHREKKWHSLIYH